MVVAVPAAVSFVHLLFLIVLMYLVLIVVIGAILVLIFASVVPAAYDWVLVQLENLKHSH